MSTFHTYSNIPDAKTLVYTIFEPSSFKKCVHKPLHLDTFM